MTVFVLLALSSCEKDINFKLNEPATALVVDAQIENDQPPFVVLTKSFSFFANINPQLLDSSFIHGADVYVSNGTLIQKLKEYKYSLATGYNSYYYSTDSSNLTTAFKGAFKGRYTLKIVSGGKEYNSSVGIPALAIFPDSVFYKFSTDNDRPNKRLLFIRAKDPPGLGNYVRYFTKRNDEPFLPGPNSVYDDQVIDGSTYTVELPAGIDRNSNIKSDSNYLRKGDLVTLKFCNIEKPVYTFWSTWEFAYQSIGNPFAQPNKVIGNISNGALGVFCGYACFYDTQFLQ